MVALVARMKEDEILEKRFSGRVDERAVLELWGPGRAQPPYYFKRPPYLLTKTEVQGA